LGRQLIKEVQPFRLGEIERQSTFVAIARKIVGAQGPEERRPPGTGVISLAWPFHLEDLGAQIAQDLTAQRSRQDARSIQYTHISKRASRIDWHFSCLL